MKKAITIALTAGLIFILAACGGGNNTDNSGNNAPTAIQGDSTPTNTVERTYVATYIVDGDGEVTSTLTLQSNNRFSLAANEFISRVASGNYTIDNNKLLLAVTDDEVYVFVIDNGTLIFESGTWLENWVEQGTIFYLSNE